MSSETFLFQAFIYLTAAVIAVPIAKRMGLGSVLGYLIAGVIIGPFGMGFVGEESQDIMHFAEFGVVMMLFVVGLELQPALLWRLRGPILGLGGLQVLLTTIAVAAIAFAFGLPWQSALAIGMIISLSSTAIALQSLTEKGLMQSSGGQSSFAILLFQDIAVIPMLAIFPLLAIHAVDAHGTEAGHGAGEHSAGLVASLPAWSQTLAVLAAVGLIILAGRFLLAPIFRAIARTGLRELFTAAALLLVIGIALLMTEVGLSPALGTFLAGVVLANSEYRHELESDIEPFKGLLLGLFFIAVGAAIDFALIAANPLLIAGMVIGVVLLKLGILFGLARLFKQGIDQSALVAVALAQVGEFAFVLLSAAGQLGVLDAEVSSPLLAVVALSMALTPLLLVLNDRVIRPRFGTREREDREADAISEESPVIIAGFGSFGNIVGRLLRANGIGTTVLDNDPDRVDLLRKIGLKVYYGDATRVDLLKAAGAQKARLIVLALDDTEANLRLVHTVQKHFPHLEILARAADRPDVYALMEAGVTRIYRDKLDTSLRLGVDALRALGFRAYRAQRAAQTFLRYDEAAIHELYEARKDRHAYIGLARQRIADLEEIMRSDREERWTERDAGWDTESLREDVRQMVAARAASSSTD
jgi:CPA2 family monovalent cation:H+ antiporter-2